MAVSFPAPTGTGIGADDALVGCVPIREELQTEADATP